MALTLRRLGITAVRPLAGGFAAWRARGYPVETLAESVATPETRSIAAD